MRHSSTSWRATGWGVAFPLLVLLAFGIPGCSDEDSSSTDTDTDDGSAQEQEQACADWAQLQAAVTALGDVEVVADGTDALRTAVDGVESALQQFGDSAGDQVGDEVDALEAAVGDLTAAVRAAVDDAAAEGAGSGLVAIGEAVQQVATAADDLAAELQPGCEA
jgi:hypothetical protein